MTFAVMRLPGKPVVLVKVDTPLENYTSNLRVTCGCLLQLIDEAQEPLYIWVDLRNVDLSFCDILIAVDEMNQAPCYPGDIHLAIIGSHPLIPVAVRRIQKQAPIDIDHFITLEEALSRSFPFQSWPANAD